MSSERRALALAAHGQLVLGDCVQPLRRSLGRGRRAADKDVGAR
jgi:hypothetical protein